MADNVISYKKKSKETFKKTKSLISLYKFGPRLQKSTEISKKTITQSRFTQFPYRSGMFWMVPGESSCQGGSEYVWQGGVEGVFMVQLL